MIEKLYDDLMELYNNSGKEFFQEMTALLKGRFPDREHTVLIRGEAGDWRVASSTLFDEDETEFLQRIAETEFLDKGEQWVRFSENRKGVLSHAAIPLSVRKKPATGLWIMENVKKERLLVDSNVLKTAQMIAVLVQTVHDEKLCIYNRYLDAETDFPGRLYFRQMMDRLQEKGHKVLVCALRRKDYREELRLNGSLKMIAEMKILADMVEELNFGTVFTVSEDTFAVITVERQTEVYAGLEKLMEEKGMGKILQGLILCPGPDDDVLEEMENRFCMCGVGRIGIPEPARNNPLMRLFGESEKHSTKKPEVPNTSRASNAEEEDFLALLERSGNL